MVPPSYGRQSASRPDIAQNAPGGHAGPSGERVYFDAGYHQRLWHEVIVSVLYEASYNPHPRQPLVSIELAARRARAAWLPVSCNSGAAVTSARIAIKGMCKAQVEEDKTSAGMADVNSAVVGAVS